VRWMLRTCGHVDEPYQCCLLFAIDFLVGVLFEVIDGVLLFLLQVLGAWFVMIPKFLGACLCFCWSFGW